MNWHYVYLACNAVLATFGWIMAIRAWRSALATHRKLKEIRRLSAIPMRKRTASDWEQIEAFIAEYAPTKEDQS